MTDHLKLRAVDAEDLEVISACLQDAIVPVCDMIFKPEDKNFIMVVQRFYAHEKESGFERVCCAFNLHGAVKVQTHNLNLQDGTRMLELLAVVIENGAMRLIFADAVTIRIELADWSLVIEDFGVAWPATAKPAHI